MGRLSPQRKWANNLDRKLSGSTLFAGGSVGIIQRRSIFGRFML